MKISINEIVENLAFVLGDQYNMTLREALKHTVSIYREKLLREEDFNSGLNYNDFSQNIEMPLEDWSHPICGTGKITTEEIPLSIRFKNRGRVNYLYVGDSTFGHAYTQTSFVEYPFIMKLKHNVNALYYIIENGKMIILDNHKQCSLGIIGVFSEPQNAVKFCDNVETILDDNPYPLSGDLLARIRQGIISGDFPIRKKGEEGVITSNSANELLQKAK